MAKITFIQPQVYPYPAVFHLAGAVRSSGHAYSVCVSGRLDHIFRHLKAERPDIVGFTCMTGIHTQLLDIAAEIKRQLQLPVILGGPHPTHFPEVLEHPAVDSEISN